MLNTHTPELTRRMPARPPGDPVAAKLPSSESSSPAASASGLSGRVGGGEGVQAPEWGPSPSLAFPEG